MSDELLGLMGLGLVGTRITATGAGTYTATRTGWHEVRIQGPGGGSGGVKATSGTPTLRSGGAGAGEYVVARHYLTAGVGYPYTNSPGGTAGAATPSNGGAGSSSSFTGPHFTQTALGGSGTNLINQSGALDDTGAAGGRRDGVNTPGSPAVQQGPGVWGGACGGTANGVAGGYAGAFSGVASASRPGSGACSLFAAGGAGAASANTSGTAGTIGSGGGGSWTATTTGIAGAAGGPGVIEVEFVGVA